jgi:hypothetical protein
MLAYREKAGANHNDEPLPDAGATSSDCHWPIFRVPLRAGVTESSSSESYDDDDTLDLGQPDADCGVLPPREECWMLYLDLV